MNINLNSEDTNIVIVGGGTAGWITALTMRTKYNSPNITVIDSSDIGILGAGEGTTPHFVQLLDAISVPVSDVIKYAQGTFKSGIKFTDWNGDGEHYYHGFANADDFSYLKPVTNNTGISTIVHTKIVNGENFDDIELTAATAEKNRTKFIPNVSFASKQKNPLHHYEGLGSHALHFNARKLADLLKEKALKRNINVIDAKVDEIITDEQGFITEITLVQKEAVKADVVFDCTGLHRLIIGRFYESEWKNYNEYLPVNRALAFNIPTYHHEPLPPYTESIAMKYGWAWKIPLQDRYGCGYVFDSKQLTDEDAVKELKEKFGSFVEIGNTFNFEAGAYKTPWVKNCLAIGLAQSFIEPLEATSIWSSILNSLNTLDNYITGLTHRDEMSIKLYNEKITKFNDGILNFIYFHYITKRTDTAFWRDFTTNNKMPDVIKVIYDNNRSVICMPELTMNLPFSDVSWYQVGTGLKFFNPDPSRNVLEVFRGLIVDYNSKIMLFKKNLNFTTDVVVDHKKLLNYIITNS